MQLYHDFGLQFGYTRPRLLLSGIAAGNIRDDAGARESLLQELGIAAKDFHLAHQDHTQTVIHVSEHEKDPGQFCDGIYCAAGEGAVAVTVADCVPLFLFLPGKNVTAVLHSGWKGTGILEQAFRILESRYRLNASDFHLVIGPSIRSCCYEVDAGRAHDFAKQWGSDTVRKEGDRFFLDLVRANSTIAGKLGLGVVHIVDICTKCNHGFGSYRRQGAVFTKMAAITGFF
ncbi:MAG: polyphenol oxidase family protein [Spirochaetales bacterium]|nr:polyphenol oxidase family protein [Spirochaetales bacterium]